MRFFSANGHVTHSRGLKVTFKGRIRESQMLGLCIFTSHCESFKGTLQSEMLASASEISPVLCQESISIKLGAQLSSSQAIAAWLPESLYGSLLEIRPN